MKEYFKRFWKFWVFCFVLSIPMAAIITIGGWSIRDPFDLPWWYWTYGITAGLALAYIQLRYFDKPK